MNSLPNQPGARLPERSFGPLTRADLALFAGASGDHNPIHIDTDFARAAGFDDVFAHGMLSMAYLGRYLEDLVGEHRLEAFSARFQAITPVRSVITCAAAITEVEDDMVRLELTCATQDSVQTIAGSATVRLARSGDNEGSTP